ncbi:excisionase [Streptomyces phage Dubu]|uniref:DUF2637 domain-containing protein n=1 Tax=Streptomyces phage Dubu TaxID=2591226 RepID=A0A514DEV2_9CAUD|nr:excisionase [Streptomyces phage Dubu]QDH92143.1 hypothetical protein SEA_DUBU_38 [Streptomyces phage Dubu]
MNTIRTRLTLAAGVVIVALTAAAFWLSYAHLHDVAATYGLGGSPERAWAWPATLDLFIVAGEILMLVAALNGKRDPWAIGLTVAGSVGSIALNVFGVGASAEPLEYVVAAVPPAAALLAFGALMRQLHAAVAAQVQEPAQDAPVVVVEKVQEAPQAPAAPAPLPEVVEELEALEAATEEPEEDDQEAPEPVPSAPEVIQVHRITSKPSVAEISAAVKDLQREGAELTGKALAAYFGVSDRSGRRYLNDYQSAA